MESTSLGWLISVLQSLATWFVSAVNTLLGILIDTGTGEPTILGLLCFAATGVGIILLILRVISGFFNFSRG